jgi:hypothetical protein
MTVTRRNVTTLAVAALVLLGAVDFWQRILVPRHLEARPPSSFVPATVPPPATAAAIRQDLVAWLPKLQPIADGSGGPEAAGGWELTLLAVFDDQRARFAVVRAQPASGGGAGEVRRVVAGDEVHGFRVARIEPLRVVLEDPQGERELRLFRPAVEPVVGTGPEPVRAGSPPPRSGATVASAPTASPPAGAKPAASSPPAPAGAKSVASQELKSGQAFELPESMRGLKFVENPPPPSNAKPMPQGAPPPQKP